MKALYNDGSESLLNIQTVVECNLNKAIFLNSINGRFKINSLNELNSIVLNLKENEFKGLELVYTKDIDENTNAINIWVTPIVKSA